MQITDDNGSGSPETVLRNYPWLFALLAVLQTETTWSENWKVWPISQGSDAFLLRFTHPDARIHVHPLLVTKDTPPLTLSDFQSHILSGLIPAEDATKAARSGDDADHVFRV